MLWKGQRQSDNIEDRRGMSRGGMVVGGGLGGIVLLVVAVLLGADPRQLLEQLPTQAPSSRTQSSRPASPEEEERKQFVATVLANTEDVWTDLLKRRWGQQALLAMIGFSAKPKGMWFPTRLPMVPPNKEFVGFAKDSRRATSGRAIPSVRGVHEIKSS